MVSLDTDLIAAASLILNVSRSYTVTDSASEYPRDYYSSQLTVADLRSPVRIPLDHEAWESSLHEHLSEMERLGAPVKFKGIRDEIEVSAIVHVRQDDPRFGKDNANLFGKAVRESSVGRVLTSEMRFNDQRAAKAYLPKYGDPHNLKRGSTYRLSAQVPLMPEFEPTNPLEAVSRIISLEAGTTFTVIEIRGDTSRPWYFVKASQSGVHGTKEGWINSNAVVSQNLAIVR